MLQSSLRLLAGFITLRLLSGSGLETALSSLSLQGESFTLYSARTVTSRQPCPSLLRSKSQVPSQSVGRYYTGRDSLGVIRGCVCHTASALEAKQNASACSSQQCHGEVERTAGIRSYRRSQESKEREVRRGGRDNYHTIFL